MALDFYYSFLLLQKYEENKCNDCFSLCFLRFTIFVIHVNVVVGCSDVDNAKIWKQKDRNKRTTHSNGSQHLGTIAVCAFYCFSSLEVL